MWRKTSLAFLSALLVGFCLLSVTPPYLHAYTGWPGGSDTKDLGKEALERQKSGDLDLAIKLHEKILALEPCNVWSREKLGDIYTQKKQFIEAILHLKEAQESIKCNRTEHVQLDDYARISKKIQKAHEEKDKEEGKKPKPPSKEPSPFKKGDKVVFDAVSILFKNVYKVYGVVVTPGHLKSRVKILDDGGSIYIDGEVYTVENAIMKKK